MKKLLILITVLCFPLMAFAQEVVQPVVDLATEVPVQDFMAFLIKSMGGMKGASTLAIVGIVLQGLLMLTRTRLLDKYTSGKKLLIVYGLSMVAGVVALMSQGLDIQAALIHSNSLAAYQVMFHEVVKKFNDKDNKSPA